jgi:hypothetical protein
MFSPVNTTLTTVGLEQNIANVAVAYIDTQPNATYSLITDPKGRTTWEQVAGSGNETSSSKAVTLTAVTEFPSVVVAGNKITGYFTDCFDNEIKYRTKDDQFVTTKKWKDIALAIANNTFSELYYYKADTRTRIVYDYIASIAPSPLPYLYTKVSFVNGVATVTLPDTNGVFVGGASTSFNTSTILDNYKVIVTAPGNTRMTEGLEIEFTPTVNYLGGNGVYGSVNGVPNTGSNSYANNTKRSITSSSDGRTLTFSLDSINTNFPNDTFNASGTFIATITTKYVTGQTYHINVDNDWQGGRNQLIKYTNLTKYQQEYLVQWINSNSDKVTWTNNVLEAVDWENSNL